MIDQNSVVAARGSLKTSRIQHQIGTSFFHVLAWGPQKLAIFESRHVRFQAPFKTPRVQDGHGPRGSDRSMRPTVVLTMMVIATEKCCGGVEVLLLLLLLPRMLLLPLLPPLLRAPVEAGGTVDTKPPTLVYYSTISPKAQGA